MHAPDFSIFHFIIPCLSKSLNAHLENTLYVPDLSKDLFSLTAAVSRGMNAEITRNECVKKRGGTPVATRMKHGFLMHLNVEVDAECHVAEYETEVWHRRLVHASYGTVNAMTRDGKIKGIEMKTDVICGVCTTSKQVRKSCYTSQDDAKLRKNDRSDIMVCFDVLGPIKLTSRSGFKYIASYMLIKRRYATVYPLRKKSEVMKSSLSLRAMELC